MSVVVMIKGSNGIVIAADGSTYGDDGALKGHVSKIEPMLNLNCVFAQVGAGGLCLKLREVIGHKYQTFEELLAGVGDDLRVATEFGMLNYALAGRKPDSTVAIAGYSTERDRYEIHKISNWDKEYMDGTELKPMPAYQLYEVDDFWSNMIPPADLSERYHLNADEMIRNASHLAARWIAACRPLSCAPDPATNRKVFGCGSFIELATFQKDRFESNIVHRWPDEIGKVIDPNAGEAMPAWMKVVSESAVGEAVVRKGRAECAFDLPALTTRSALLPAVCIWVL